MIFVTISRGWDAPSGTRGFKGRRVQELDLWITDGHQAMLNAITLKFPTSQRQSCIKHKMDIVLSHVPEKQHEAVRQE